MLSYLLGSLIAEPWPDPLGSLTAFQAPELRRDPIKSVTVPPALHDGRQQIVWIEHHNPTAFAVQAQRVAMPGIVFQIIETLVAHGREHGRNK